MSIQAEDLALLEAIAADDTTTADRSAAYAALARLEWTRDEITSELAKIWAR
jgi:hypothetical protein